MLPVGEIWSSTWKHRTDNYNQAAPAGRLTSAGFYGAPPTDLHAASGPNSGWQYRRKVISFPGKGTCMFLCIIACVQSSRRQRYSQCKQTLALLCHACIPLTACSELHVLQFWRCPQSLYSPPCSHSHTFNQTVRWLLLLHLYFITVTQNFLAMLILTDAKKQNPTQISEQTNHFHLWQTVHYHLHHHLPLSSNSAELATSY